MYALPKRLELLRYANGLVELGSVAVSLGLVGPLKLPLSQLWESGLVSEAVAIKIQKFIPDVATLTLGEFLRSSDLQRPLKGRFVSEERRELLRAARTLIETSFGAPTRKPAPAVVAQVAPSPDRPRGRSAVIAWAKVRGVLHRLDAPIGALEALVGRALVEEFQTRSTPSVGALLFGEWSALRGMALKTLQDAAWAFLEAEAKSVARAADEEPAFLSGPSPEHPILAELYRLLLSVRPEIRRVCPLVPIEVRDLARVELRADPLALKVADPRELVTGWNTTRATVSINLERWREDHVEFRCSFCQQGGECGHIALAADASLRWLRSLDGAASEQAAAALMCPPWMRALQKLEEAVKGPEREAGVPVPEPVATRVAWRIENRKGGARLKPVLRRAAKRGGWTGGTSISLGDVARDDRREYLPHDRRAAAFLLVDNLITGAGHIWHALVALEGHPDVAFASKPDEPIRVAEVELAFACVEVPGGGYSLEPSVDGTAVSLDSLQFINSDRTRFFFCDEARNTCYLVRARPEVAQAVSVLAKNGAFFPADAAEELARRLWSFPVPVTLPRALLGAEVDADPTTLLTAQLDGLALCIEGLVRPLPGALTFPVADGPGQVRGTEDGRRIFALRRPEVERSQAEALFGRLGLPLPEAGQPMRATAEGELAIEWLRKLETAAKDGTEVLWPPRRPAITRALVTKDLRVSVRPARDWFGVGGVAQVDDRRIELALLLEAARKKQRFVRLGDDAWAELSDELISSLQPLAELAVGTSEGTIEASVAAAPVLETLAQKVESFEGIPKLSDLLEKMRTAASVTPKLPPGLVAELRPYQLEGFEWMTRLAAWAPGACLADDMGLGKTLQTLAVMLARGPLGPQLVVAPTSVCFNWEKEAARFAPSLLLHSWRGAPDRDALLASLGPNDVLVVSYGLLTRDAERLKSIAFATAVFDEAQAVKNSGAQRSKAAREVRAEFRLALTGTPLENHLGELWSLMRVIFPGLLGSEAMFRERFWLPIEKTRDPDRKKALAGIVRPFLLRRTKGQVATELPARTEVLVPITLSAQERSLYEDARLASLAQLEGADGGDGFAEKKRFQVLAALTRLRLLACHPALHDPSWKGPASKLEQLLDLVRQLRAEGHRALIFSQFTGHLGIVRNALEQEGVRLQYLDGQTPERDRRLRVEAFQEGSGEVFLISLKAGGTGLNLTGADYVIHLDPWWNPAVEDQATDRAHRIGQTRPVTVLRLVAQGTVEEQILALHGDKRSLLAGVLDGTGEPTRFDVDELVSLLRFAGSGGVTESEEDAGEREAAPTEGPVAADVPAPAAPNHAAPSPANGSPPQGSGGTTRGADADAFRSWLREQHEQGHIGPGPVKSYPRSVERFLGFVSERRLALQPPAQFEGVLNTYLEALQSGQVDAPGSEPLLAKSAVRKFGAFLQSAAGP